MNNKNQPLDLNLGGLPIGQFHPPFVIAEMSGNHNGSLERALALVDAAANAGAHALKLQTYTADTMTIDGTTPDFVISEPESPWHGENLYRLYQKAATPWEWHGALFARCRERGIICFSTPFDETAVDFLESLHCPFYKIASFEACDTPLLEKVAATRKPVIVSTGMMTLDEMRETLATLKNAKADNIVFLKCTSAYPADASDANLLTIPDMRATLGCEIGLSDHTAGVGVAVASIALGARVIEKHFTLRRTDGGVDAAFSLEPEELKMLVDETRRAWASLGNIHYGISESEKKSLRFRRSVYVVRDVKSGEILTTENLRIIRPGFGLAPKHHKSLIGKQVTCDVKRGTPMRWEFV